MLRRRSHSSVGDKAPGDKELRKLLEAAGTVADHAALHPWRVIAIRGEARERVGRAIAEATGQDASSGIAKKPLRAPLLLAVVVSPRPSMKVPDWEQEATASGVAHALSLLLDEAGWGVMWRTGLYTRSGAVHRAHELAPHEHLLGWLYVGSKPEKKSGRRKPITAKKHLSSL
ncbi:nitroreductase [Protaetiibacter intestinalis]|uniref:Putative NAD(P)H nitroreductase n=2 Tax=Protaetiibacter intestinalis TaxID=2419774 RepID=A0A387B6Z8_9MICO|nr:nitroreductase [Protaetiibacter intestinalis]